MLTDSTKIYELNELLLPLASRGYGYPMVLTSKAHHATPPRTQWKTRLLESDSNNQNNFFRTTADSHYLNMRSQYTP